MYHTCTHQLPSLHALHYHEEDLLWLILAVVKGLLNADQQLVSGIITYCPGNTNACFSLLTIYLQLSTLTTLIKHYSYPSFSVCLWAKERMSEARPLPSHTTTGTGGSSRKLSSTTVIMFGPPSTIRHTSGTPWPKPQQQQQKVTLRLRVTLTTDA